MQPPFDFDGTKIDGDILFYWSTVSIGRALRFYAEAQNQQTPGYVLATIATYYCTFHLGVFLCYSVPDLLEEDMVCRINKRLQDGRKDPRRALSHEGVRRFLTRCQSHGLPGAVIQTFEKAQALREFVNYGPDLRYNSSSKKFQISNRAHHPREYLEVVKQTEGAFDHSVDWACRKGTLNGELVLNALDKAASYFTSNEDGEPYYSQWSSQDVLKIAESLRAVLYEKARKLVYPGKRT